MRKDRIREVRQALGITQAQLGHLLGVHHLTVSRWERGQLTPSPYQSAFLFEFGVAANVNSGAGKQALMVLSQAGVVRAVYVLLDTASLGRRKNV